MRGAADLPRAAAVPADVGAATDGLFDLFRWVFSEWLPAAGLRWRFAPVVTRFDHARWYATGFAGTAAQVFVPVHARHSGPA